MENSEANENRDDKNGSSTMSPSSTNQQGNDRNPDDQDQGTELPNDEQILIQKTKEGGEEEEEEEIIKTSEGENIENRESMTSNATSSFSSKSSSSLSNSNSSSSKSNSDDNREDVVNAFSFENALKHDESGRFSSSFAESSWKNCSSSKNLGKYLQLIDMSGLALAMKSVDDIAQENGKRLRGIEDTICRFPNDYVTADEVRDSMERIDNLSKKVKKILDSAERTQKVDTLKINGEIGRLSGSLGNLDARISRFEAENQASSDTLRTLTRSLDDKVTRDELRTVKLQMDKSVQKSEMLDLENNMKKNFVRLSELDTMKKSISDSLDQGDQIKSLQIRFSTEITNIKTMLDAFVTTEDLERVEDCAMQALDRTKHLKAGFDRITGDLDKISGKLGELEENLNTKVGYKALEEELSGLKSLMQSKVEEMNQKNSRIIDRVEALSDTVGANARSAENVSEQLEKLALQLEDKVAGADLDELEKEIDDLFVNKEDLGTAVEPIVRKLNQVVAKLIDLDKIVVSKADNDTAVENRGHIQDLFRLVQSVSIGNDKARKKSSAGNEGSSSDGHSPMVSTATPRRKSIAPETVKNLEEKLKENAELISVLKNEIQANSGAQERVKDLEKKIEEQNQTISQLAAQFSEIRNILLQRNDGGVDFYSDRIPHPPNTTTTTSTTASKTMAMEGGAFPLSSDKQNWDKSERERWLAEKRTSFSGSSRSGKNIAEPRAPSSTASSSSSSSSASASNTTLPKL